MPIPMDSNADRDMLWVLTPEDKMNGKIFITVQLLGLKVLFRCHI